MVTGEDIQRRIFLLRGQRVVLSDDLAGIYGVETRALNQAVKRNIEKFPSDFMFQLTREEAEQLYRSRSQSVSLKRGRNIKYLPYAFTEHGAIMAATILNSPRAVQMSVRVVRAFVRMRQVLAEHKELAAKLASQCAGKFGAAEFGYWAGLWHDLGKFHPDFQTYIASPESRRGPDHSSAGAVHAAAGFDLLAFLVAGHHSGLPNKTDLKLRLEKKANAQVAPARKGGRGLKPGFRTIQQHSLGRYDRL